MDRLTNTSVKGMIETIEATEFDNKMIQEVINVFLLALRDLRDAREDIQFLKDRIARDEQRIADLGAVINGEKTITMDGETHNSRQ